MRRFYILSPEDDRKLDRLLSAALTDAIIKQRLISQRDPTLFEEFGLSAGIAQWILATNATSLTQLANIILTSRGYTR